MILIKLERGREVERVMREQSSSSKVKKYKGTKAITTTASSLAKKVRGVLTMNSSKTYSNRESGKNK